MVDGILARVCVHHHATEDRRVHPDHTNSTVAIHPPVAHRTLALNFTTPPWPGRITPGSSQRTTIEPTSLAPAEKFAALSDWFEPGTYSSRPLRLSLTTTSEIGRLPV